MNAATFWKMIEDARKDADGDIEKQTELLVEALSKESDEDIIEFNHIMQNMMDRAYRGNLWDACVFIHCGCADDDFEDFRAWLIAQGEGIFEKAIKDPESLVELLDPKHRDKVVFEEFAYVGKYAYRRKTGKEVPLVFREHRLQLVGVTHDEDELPLLFPALMAKLGSCREWWDNWTGGEN